MNQINDPGNPKEFGHEFNYSVWTANNIFTLCNVPWNADYRDVFNFSTHAQLDAYIDGLASPRVQIQGTRAKLNMPLRVGMTLAKAMKYNYLRVKNGLQPVESGDELQSFYYFIVGMREINPETTELYLQLDVWASFRPAITGMRGYVERGHVGMANSKRMNNYGRDYLTVPEGLDIGQEYRGIAVRNQAIMTVFHMNVIAFFANDPTAPKTKEVAGKTVPNYTASKGGFVFGVPSGAAARMWESPTDFMLFMNDNNNTPWVTSGILSIMLVPHLDNFNLPNYFDGYDPLVGKAAPASPLATKIINLNGNNWRNSSFVVDQIPARYRALDKLKTSPYMVLEITTFSATPIQVNPENWPNDNVEMNMRASMMPPNARIQYSPRNYGQTSPAGVDGGVDNTSFVNDRGGSHWDMFTQITNLPTIPIVNDGAILALANQANSIAFSRQSADWSQTRALAGAQTGYDQATMAMRLANESLDIEQSGAASQNAIQNQLARDSAAASIIGGIGGGAGMGAFAGAAGAIGGAAGGVVSGAGNAVQTMLQIDASQKSLASQFGTQRQGLAAAQNNAEFVRDSNQGLSQYASRGDYANNLAGINAKVRDLQMTPASVVGQMGGELLNLMNSHMGVSVRWKLIDNAALKVVGEFWLRYGYSVRQFYRLPSNFKVMSKFTYWKMSETYLGGAHIPENLRQALRGIFEKGVTMWENPSDLANVDYDIADNTPIAGIELP